MNTLFPGRPDYVGPKSGMFAFLHHEILCEPSDNVMERVDYVRHHKPPAEIETRLHHMMFLDAALCPAVAKRAPLYADYEAKRAPLYADYGAKRATLYTNYAAKRSPLDADYEAKLAPVYADYAAKLATLYADYEAKCAMLYADYEAKRATLDADYEAKRATLDADYGAKRAPLDGEILDYIKAHIPDCSWNGESLVF